MSVLSLPHATLEDLYRSEGKAELINGTIFQFMASGHLPTLVALEIYVSLRGYVKATGRGVAYGDGIGFAIPELPSGRESFSPDASYYAGPLPANLMRFVDSPPTFAVEVRSQNDYGTTAEIDMAAKRSDYFAAGTLVVWDVDPQAKTITSYQATAVSQPIVYKMGDTANAEPAVPGWTMAVADVFGV